MLSRCSFCGADRPPQLEHDFIQLDGLHKHEEYFHVWCNRYIGGCGARSGYCKSHESAIELWNKTSACVLEAG